MRVVRVDQQSVRASNFDFSQGTQAASSGNGSGDYSRRISVAQPVNNSSSKRTVAQENDNDNGDISANRLAGPEGSSPRERSRSPAVRTTTTTAGGQVGGPDVKQSSPTGKSSASGSQPAYASDQAPSARELALRASADLTRAAMQAKDPLKELRTIFKSTREVRLVLPARFSMEDKSNPYSQLCGRKWLKELPIRHLDLRFAPEPVDAMQCYEQIIFVGKLLTAFNELGKREPSLPILALDLPMLPPTGALPSLDDMYAKNFHDALASTEVEVRARVNDYHSKWDRLGCLVFNGEILAGNKNITELELANCEFDDEVTGKIANALKTNTSIKKLVLNNCSIPEAGTAALAQAFSERPDLQVVGFAPAAAASSAPQGNQRGGSSRTAGDGFEGPAVAPTRSIPKVPAANTANSSTTTTTTTSSATTATTTPAASTTVSTTAGITGKPPAHFRTAPFNAEYEAELADSAAGARAALMLRNPITALKLLFNQHATVRIEVPAKILWRVDDKNGVGDGYEKFSRIKCLSALKLRNIEFRPQQCEAGESQTCQFDFLACTLDSLNQLPKKDLLNTSLAIVLPNAEPAKGASEDTARAQDGVLKSLANDRLTARLDLGALLPRAEGSAALCRFFDSLPGKTRLVEIRLCGAVLSRAETSALADGLRENQSLQVLDITGVLLDAGVRDQFHDALEDRPDLKVIE